MRGKGITFDTGFIHRGSITREDFDPDVVEREMRVIGDDLHCTAVRITGGDSDRPDLAARSAADAGMEVWWSPFTCDLTVAEMLGLLADGAARAERLRAEGADVVFLTGSELSLVNHGFVSGGTFLERAELLRNRERLREALPALPGRINAFLATAVAVVRERFGGRVGYASLPFEGVDWTPFDVVATDAVYPSPGAVNRVMAGVRALTAASKPVAVTEFGCTTYRGSAASTGRGDEVIVWSHDARPLELDGAYVRDEEEQAAYIREVLALLAAAGVDSAFVNTFVRYDLPHREDARRDLDLASYGVVKVLDGRLGTTYPGMPWEPKAAFFALADAYAHMA